MNHTPLPWSAGCIINEESKCNCLYILSDNYMGSIARVTVSNGLNISEGGNDAPSFDEAKANAEYIVKACNAFPELVAALERMKNWAHWANEKMGFDIDPKFPEWAEATAALAKAGLES